MHSYHVMPTGSPPTILRNRRGSSGSESIAESGTGSSFTVLSRLRYVSKQLLYTNASSSRTHRKNNMNVMVIVRSNFCVQFNIEETLSPPERTNVWEAFVHLQVTRHRHDCVETGCSNKSNLTYLCV
jgi:hypothetical protein